MTDYEARAEPEDNTHPVVGSIYYHSLYILSGLWVMWQLGKGMDPG